MPLADARTLVYGTAAAILRPPDALRIEKWAESNVRLGALTSDPGEWRADKTPYVRQILEVAGPDHPAKRVTWVAGTQLGKTTSELVIASYYLCQCPAQVLVVLPDKRLAEEWSTKRLADVFESSPKLRGRMVDEHDRKTAAGQNTTYAKRVPNGGAVKITWASSGSGVRSTPSKIVLNDEVEEFGLDVKDQGNALRLLERRMTNYGGAKMINASSPKNAETSVIWPEFLEGDQRRFFLPCPQCDHRQVLRPQNFEWPAGHPELAGFRCVSCREVFSERYKTQMLAAGVWVATADHPGLVDLGFSSAELPVLEPVFETMAAERFVSFHLPSYYSPIGWYSWEEAALDYEKSEGIPHDRKVYVNTTQAEVWRGDGERLQDELLEARAQDYPRGVVPIGAAVVTIGVDVQENRFEYEVVGWGPNRQRYSIDYQTIPGDTLQREIWLKLHELLMKEWPTAEGGRLPVQAMAIDTGYRPERAYDFARAHTQIPYNPAQWRVASPRTVICTKGNDRWDRIINGVSSADAAARRGVRIFHVGTGIAKFELTEALRYQRPKEGESYPTGYCHFPRYEATYFAGLCSETLVSTDRGKQEWRPDPSVRNEPLDCAILNRAAAALCGVEEWSNEYWLGRLADCRPRHTQPVREIRSSTAFQPVVPDDPYLGE